MKAPDKKQEPTKAEFDTRCLLAERGYLVFASPEVLELESELQGDGFIFRITRRAEESEYDEQCIILTGETDPRTVLGPLHYYRAYKQEKSIVTLR